MVANAGLVIYSVYHEIPFLGQECAIETHNVP